MIVRTDFLKLPARLRYPTQVAVVALAYLGAAKLGLLAAVAQKVVSSAWPPSGVALATLLLFGLRYWPGVAAGAFLLNWTAGVPAAGAAGIALGNTLEAVSAVWLLQRVVAFRPSLERLRDVLALVTLAALASTTVSATVGVVSLWASGVVERDALKHLWFVWWSGDALGDVLVAPLLLTWARATRPAGRWPEAAALVVLLVLLTALLLRSPLTYVYAVFPVAVWAAVRFGPRGSATATALIAGLMIWYTLRGLGPFAGATPTENLALLQAFLALASVTGLVLAAATAERGAAEGVARESEQRFGLLVESVRDHAIVGLDQSGRVVSWNAGAEHIEGYTAQEILGRSLACFYTPEDAAAGKPAENLREAAERGRCEVQGWRVRKDGSRFWADVVISPVRNGTGALLGFAKVTRDLTERRRVEEALREQEALLRATFEQAAVGIAVAGLDARFVRTNHVFQRMLGYSDAELQHLTYVDITYAEDLPRNRELMAELAEGKRHAFTLEKRYCRKDGSLLWVQITVSALPSRQGEPRLFVWVIEDITERRGAQEQLHRHREQLRDLAARLEAAREAERTRIAREIHDELGQALTALKIDLTWLKRRLPQPAPELAGKVDGMEAILNDTASAVQRIATELRPGVLDELGLQAAIQWQAREFETRTGIACRVELAAEQSAVDATRATAAFRIFQEALTNVARHAGATQVLVRFTLSAQALDLSVQDNGRGISEGALADSGSLGLVGMRERATTLGGTVTITGVPGRGTTLTLHLPSLA
jgi:PAS domain S-box-containing protein